jgi:hypothetical protein
MGAWMVEREGELNAAVGADLDWKEANDCVFLGLFNSSLK